MHIKDCVAKTWFNEFIFVDITFLQLNLLVKSKFWQNKSLVTVVLYCNCNYVDQAQTMADMQIFQLLISSIDPWWWPLLKQEWFVVGRTVLGQFSLYLKSVSNPKNENTRKIKYKGSATIVTKVWVYNKDWWIIYALNLIDKYYLLHRSTSLGICPVVTTQWTDFFHWNSL